jgi:D-alanyl-D-alanine carboxypeptidase
MVMRLATTGAVDLDAPVSRYAMPVPSADRITVRMLLSHRSGLPDYLESPEVLAHVTGRPLDPWTRDEALAGVGEPVRPPGEAFEYSNTNYVALGAVLESAGDGPEAELRRLVAPLALARTSFVREDPPGPDVARGHGPGAADLPGGRIPADVWGPVWTDGGLATTAPELARVLDALMHDRLLPPGVVARMAPAAGEPYGLGLIAGEYDGVRWIGHNGAYGGYTSEVWHSPGLGVTLAVLANSDAERGGAPPAQAIAHVLGDRLVRDAR